MVHGYLGRMASREMEQFFTEAELRRLAHQYDGVWIAPTRSTYLPDIFPEMPYIVHQNSTLAWAILMYIHKQQDQSPLKRSSTSLHRQKNTLYLESLRYAVILHAKRILKTLEDNCMKCLRRKKQFLKQSLGQPLAATFEKEVRPFRYVQMDITGKHIAEKGEEIYGIETEGIQEHYSNMRKQPQHRRITHGNSM